MNSIHLQKLEAARQDVRSLLDSVTNIRENIRIDVVPKCIDQCGPVFFFTKDEVNELEGRNLKDGEELAERILHESVIVRYTDSPSTDLELNPKAGVIVSLSMDRTGNVVVKGYNIDKDDLEPFEVTAFEVINTEALIDFIIKFSK